MSCDKPHHNFPVTTTESGSSALTDRIEISSNQRSLCGHSASSLSRSDKREISQTLSENLISFRASMSAWFQRARHLTASSASALSQRRIALFVSLRFIHIIQG